MSVLVCAPVARRNLAAFVCHRQFFYPISYQTVRKRNRRAATSGTTSVLCQEILIAMLSVLCYSALMPRDLISFAYVAAMYAANR